MPIEQLAADNAIELPDRVRAGQELRINRRPVGVRTIRPGHTLSGVAGELGVDVPTLLGWNSGISDPNRIVAGGTLRTAPPAAR
ncbi:MAG: LysM peptidoglycan-binding domain-containing protein [Pseudonocardia sp.]